MTVGRKKEEESVADRKEDSEENHVGSQDLHHMSLHSVTLCAMPCVEAVLQRMRWADCDFPILNKIQCCGFPPPPTKVWENLYPGRRMVMDLGGSSGNWEAAQLCLRQTQFFFFFAGGARSTIAAIFPICLFLSPFLLCYSNLLSPKVVSGGIMTQKWALC